MPHADAELFDALQREVALRRVNRRDAGEYALFKYNTVQQLSREWTPVRRAARGVVFHVPTGSVVCRPIRKFFNLDEDDETRLENLPAAPDVSAVVEEKLDGSCVALHLRDGVVRCVTPGSFTSEQAMWAESEIRRRGLDTDARLRELLAGTTLVCEAIYPENVSVVDYGDRRDLALLAAVDLDGGEHPPVAVDAIAQRFGLARPRRFDLAVSREMPVASSDEGYVVSYWQGPVPTRVKVKGAEFLRLHPVISDMTERSVLDLIETGRLDAFAAQMPRAARAQADDFAAALTQRFRSLRTRADAVAAAVRDLPTRKDRALAVLRLAPDPAVRFLAFFAIDGVLTDAAVWALVRKSLRCRA
ncbi:MAG: T4 RnlA family RNA ligase [Planctomycetes bacterium]|nr:T4 RnlA family RNA ligase [Planctomycetota bacterium]